MRYTAQDLSGKSLMRAPDWSANFGFDYELPLKNGVRVAIGSMTTYSSSYFTNILHRADMKQKDFAKTSLNVTFKGPDDHWQVAVIGDNLTNKIVATNCVNANYAFGNKSGTMATGTGGSATPASPGEYAGSDELMCSADRGRSLWMRLSVKY